ncbi:collagen alpha-1(X) chain-like isoform X2 [Passer montanus]|uniref:collagen alpha-1(X) chain-like isoform X2 n=1 Tax=Passer montanus TaxID=9160 RepID=UPI0019603D7D|nr:collagen alpha-1(X) chain-like isoform X2 [Passer montanus]
MAMGHKRGQPGETPANSQKPPPGFRAPGPVGATALPCPVPEVGTAGRPGGHRHRRGGGNGALPQLLPSGTRPAAPQGCVAELPPRPDPAPSLTRNGNGALGRPQIPEIPAGAAQELPWAGIPCPGTRERLFGVCCDPSPVGSLGCQLLVPSWMGTLSVTAPPGPPRARGSDKDVSAALPPPGPGTRPSTPNFEAIPQLQQAGRGDSSSVPPQGTPLKCHQTFQCHKSQDKPQQGHPQNPLPNTEPCIKLRLREKNVKKMKTEINKIDERREKAARRRGSVAVCYANRGGLRAGGRAGEV